MPKSRTDGRGNGEFRKLTPRAKSRVTPHTIVVCETAGFLGLCDVCLQQQVYLGIQVSGDGGAVGLTILDGTYRRRAWCHTQSEFDSVVSFQWDRIAAAGGAEWGTERDAYTLHERLREYGAG